MERRYLIQCLLESIGEDPKREGLRETPDRVDRMYEEIFGGYGQQPRDILSKVFLTTNDQMVVCKDIEFYSHCEHHIVPFFGKVHIGYLPDGKVVGVSKLVRLVECFAKRLQIQENLTSQIAESLEKALECRGVGVVIQAQHLCMKMRGVRNHSSVMVTSALIGAFKKAEVKAEFFTHIGGNHG